MVDSDDSDEDLAARAGRGDRLAAAALIERHSGRILRVCQRHLGDRAEAEDAAQETFLKLWRALPYWRPQGLGLEAWLAKVATNACLDRLRRRRRLAPETEAPERIDAAPLADASMAARERSGALAAALAALPERQRLAVVLCHYEERSNIDAAAAMNISVEAVESLLSRARRTLRESLAPRRAELMGGD